MQSTMVQLELASQVTEPPAYPSLQVNALHPESVGVPSHAFAEITNDGLGGYGDASQLLVIAVQSTTVKVPSSLQVTEPPSYPRLQEYASHVDPAMVPSQGTAAWQLEL